MWPCRQCPPLIRVLRPQMNSSIPPSSSPHQNHRITESQNHQIRITIPVSVTLKSSPLFSMKWQYRMCQPIWAIGLTLKAAIGRNSHPFTGSVTQRFSYQSLSLKPSHSNLCVDKVHMCLNWRMSSDRRRPWFNLDGGTPHSTSLPIQDVVAWYELIRALQREVLGYLGCCFKGGRSFPIYKLN